MDVEETSLERLQKMGRRIAAERDRLGHKQSDVAEACGLTREMWSRYERGLTEISEHALRRFCEMGANRNYLLDGTAIVSEGATREDLQRALELLAAEINKPNPGLNPEELEVLNHYRAAIPDRKRFIMEILRAAKNVT